MSRKFFLAALLAVSVAGCTKSDMAPVTGVLTLNGQPASGAEVMFNPKTAGRLAVGKTDEAGRFKLSTGAPDDGAVPGEYVVTLGEYYGPDNPPKMTSGPLPSRFPQKYGDPSTSPLTAKVEREGKNEFTFEVTK
jgi:hypothetical protein